MLIKGVFALFAVTLSASCLAANFSLPGSPTVKQSYGQLLPHTDTSSLPARVKSALANVTTHLKKQPGGTCVQFVGGSDTGKTLAASRFAEGLGRDVYRVDLAAVMSKYIGETEKNLDRIFSTAAADNWVLFFDEADALFGKRSKVKDAHDRYANIESNYLLAKLEEYQGIWILASNKDMKLKSGLDKRCTHKVKIQ